MPSGSMDSTFSFALDFRAVPAKSRLSMIAGSVVWKNRRRSRSPPSSLTTFILFARRLSSVIVLKPRRRKHQTVQSMISGSVFETRRAPRLHDPSASKIPARYPLHQSLDAERGHAIRPRIRSTLPRDDVRMAEIARRVPVDCADANSVVATPTSDRYSFVLH